MEVISLDENRVKILEKTVLKKSNENECQTLFDAYEIVNKLKEVSINGKLYKIRVPMVYSFCDNTIEMERCFGNNLELILRDKTTHKIGVEYINALLNFFIDNNFYWKDFAPRNIMINDETNEIYIMDFERGLKTEIDDLRNYFVDSVYEEYSAFLLPNERCYSVEEVFDESKEPTMKVSSISSRRVRAILNKMGYQNIVPVSKYILAVKVIIVNEEPYEKDGEIIYPLIELEEYMKSNTHENYAEKVLEVYYGKNNNI